MKMKKYKTGAFYWIKKHEGQKDWEIGMYVDHQGAFYPGLVDQAGKVYPGFILTGTRIGIYEDEVYKIGPEAIPPAKDDGIDT